MFLNILDTKLKNYQKCDTLTHEQNLATIILDMMFVY